MEVSPTLYHRFVRPKWMTRKYIHDHIEKHFDLRNQRVLDFGAGTGANCEICTPEHYLGVDPDHRRIQFAKRLYPDYQFHVLEDDVPGEEQSYDYVMIVAVLHHIPTEDIQRYVPSFRRVMREQGKIVVIEPCLRDETPLRNRFMNWWDKGEYIRNEQSYLKLFEDHGFTCEVIHRFHKGLLYNEVFFTASPTQQKAYH